MFHSLIGLNPGEIVGILFGALAFLLIVAVVTMVFLRGRRSPGEMQPISFENPVYTGNNLEMMGKNTPETILK